MSWRAALTVAREVVAAAATLEDLAAGMPAGQRARARAVRDVLIDAAAHGARASSELAVYEALFSGEDVAMLAGVLRERLTPERRAELAGRLASA